MSGCTTFFPHNLLKGTNFEKKKHCVFRFSLCLSERLIVLKTIQRDVMLHVHRYLCHISIIFVIF
jgi:hypothetical protein